MRTMTCLIGAEHDIAVHLCNFIKDSRGSSRVLPYHAQKKARGRGPAQCLRKLAWVSQACLAETVRTARAATEIVVPELAAPRRGRSGCCLRGGSGFKTHILRERVRERRGNIRGFLL